MRNPTTMTDREKTDAFDVIFPTVIVPMTEKQKAEAYDNIFDVVKEIPPENLVKIN